MDSSEPVVIQAIMLSDLAVREAGTNKLTLVGVFANWNATQFPFRAPVFAITPFIANFRPGKPEYALTVRIENKDGVVLWNVGGKLGFPIPAMVNPNALIDPTVMAQGLTFPAAGRYKVVVLIDNEIVGTRHFDVLSITTALNPGSPSP